MSKSCYLSLYRYKSAVESDTLTSDQDVTGAVTPCRQTLTIAPDSSTMCHQGRSICSLNPRPSTHEQDNPGRVVIGVTGHRTLKNIPELTQAVQVALAKIKQMVPPMRNMPVVCSVLSPLAEGADRLVAKEVLKVPGSILEVALPMEKDDYIRDFITNESKMEFEELLSEAKSVRVLPAQRSRTKAYEQVGHYVVDNCDVLIAIWDGESAAGQGGTAEIVQYARDQHRLLIWINANNARKISEEPADGLSTTMFRGDNNHVIA